MDNETGVAASAAASHAITTEAVEQSYLVRDNIKLPARKVNIFIVNPNFGSPWGESILKPVYNNWYVKDWMVKFHARVESQWG